MHSQFNHGVERCPDRKYKLQSNAHRIVCTLSIMEIGNQSPRMVWLLIRQKSAIKIPVAIMHT